MVVDVVVVVVAVVEGVVIIVVAVVVVGGWGVVGDMDVPVVHGSVVVSCVLGEVCGVEVDA